MQHHAQRGKGIRPDLAGCGWNENEAAATKTYIAELEADIMPVDGLIGFAESRWLRFGADKAKEVAAHAKEIKARGKIL